MKKTVVISCAGQGLRLGQGIPKCLVEVNGRSLIELQLEQLKNVSDVRVVVGYKKEMVIKKLQELNFNGKIVENINYMNTGTAGSFCSAIDDTVEDLIIALDGDLIINPEDMQKVLESNEQLICGEKINTENPVLVTLNDNNEVTKFSRKDGQYEWAGLAQVKKENLIKGTNHVYQLLESLLPLKFQLIRAKEIDTPSDLEQASIWIEENITTKKDIMDNWFKSRFNITDNYVVSRHGKNNRIEYDMDLILKYVDNQSKILDLGCGTGIIEEKLAQYVKYIKAIDKYQEFLQRAQNLKNVEYAKHDVVTYKDKMLYDTILMFGVTVYMFDNELENTIQNCYNMMSGQSTFIIKNQWSMGDEDYIVDKQYSKENNTQYFGIYRSLSKMEKMLSQNGMSCEKIDLYPKELNLYENTHEYALVCKKTNK